MKGAVVFAFLIFIFCIKAFSQEWAKASEPTKDYSLQLGDRIPLKQLHNMINYPSKTLTFADHKPKLFILDFWGVKCSPCIKFWPHLLKLQEEFGSDLMIIPVNKYEDEKTVKTCLQSRARIDGVKMNLPISCRDTATWKYFPQMDVPRYVWVDGNGVIVSITRSKEVTMDNIKRWITTGPFGMEQIKAATKMYSVQPRLPIFVNGNGGERSSDDFIWSTSLTKGQTDLGAEARIFYEDGFGYGISTTNSSIAALYGTAYNNRLREWDYFDYLPYSRIKVEAKDTSTYYQGKNMERTYNYQMLSGRPRTRAELIKTMQRDLDSYFGLDVTWERRRKKCLVFSMFDSSRVKGKSRGAEVYLRNDNIIVDSCKVKDLITAMELSTEYRGMLYPIVDETQYNGWITGIRETGRAVVPAEFDKVLSKYGMHLRFEMREVDVLVLRERKIP